ncbi:MAG: hypothetical protein JXK51_04710, partial [Halothiobacillaceae bacterium]|nr:hypothetical protein [Halothiobacillaceae bacterium]
MPPCLPRPLFFLSLRDRLLLIAALLLAVLIYWPGLSGGFTFDDFGNLIDNAAMAPQAVRAHFWAAVWSSGSGPTDRPISMFTFALQDWFTGLAPWPFKLVNVLIHITNGLLVFVLVRAVVGWVFAGSLPPTPTPPPQGGRGFNVASLLPQGERGLNARFATPPPQPLPHEGGGALASASPEG